METCISQAAQYMRYGSHKEADRVLREFQASCTNDAAVQCALDTLETTPAAISHAHSDQVNRSSAGEPSTTGDVDSVYRHFIALKLLRSAVLRARGVGAAGEPNRLVGTLLHYAHHSLGDLVLHSHWRPVVSELCITIAAFLKWNCVNEMSVRAHAETWNNDAHGSSDSNIVNNSNSSSIHCSSGHYSASIPCSPSVPDSRANDEAGIRIVLESAMSVVNLLVHHSTTAATLLLHRMLVETVVMEFGLYTTATQQRGLTMSQHRHSRCVFEMTSALPRMVHAVLQSMLDSDPRQETSGTIQAGWAALVTTLSWGSHRYFMEHELSEEESCACFSVKSDLYWDELLLHGMLVNNTHTLINTANDSATGHGNVLTTGGSISDQHAAATATTTRLSMFELLSRWCAQSWASGHVPRSGVPSASDGGQRPMEALQLLCCFRGEQWGPQEVSHFVYTALNTCVSLLECRLTAVMCVVYRAHAAEAAAAQGDALPQLAGAVRRLINRYAEDMATITAVQPLMLRLCTVTEQVIRWNASPRGCVEGAGTSESVRTMWRGNGMACLDELLHAWYSLISASDTRTSRAAAAAAPRTPGNAHSQSCEGASTYHSVLAQCGANIFATYVHSRCTVGGVAAPASSSLMTANSRPPQSNACHAVHDSNSSYDHTSNHRSAVDDEDDEDGYSEALTLAQLHLMARLGRCSTVSSCAVLYRYVCQLGEALWQCGAKGGVCTDAVVTSAVDASRLAQLNDPLWFVWTLIASFIADPSESEQASIPLCFLQTSQSSSIDGNNSNAMAENISSIYEHSHGSDCMHTVGEVGAFNAEGCSSDVALVQLMQSVLHFTPLLVECMYALAGSTDFVMSPAVVSSYVEVLRRYIGTYMEAAPTSSTSMQSDDLAMLVYAHALGGGTAVMHAALTMSVHVLQQMPYDVEATQAVCDLLDTVTACSEAVWRYVEQHASTRALWELALPSSGAARKSAVAARVTLAGHTRGRLLAFLLTCCLPPASGAESSSSASWVTHALEAFIRCQERNSCDAVGELREVLDGVDGLCSTAQRRAPVLQTVCPILTHTAQDIWLPMCRAAFHDRHLALALLRGVCALFVACATQVDELALTELVHLVGQTMRWATASVSSWSLAAARARGESGGGGVTSADGKDVDSVTALLEALANLLQTVSRWRRMDCLWPEEDYPRDMHNHIMLTPGRDCRSDETGNNALVGIQDRRGDTRLVVLAQCHVDTLVALVSAIDAEQLHLPRLVEALLAALEGTVTAFPAMCVAHESLRTLVSVMFYATQADSARMQCAGMETCVQVVECMSAQLLPQKQGAQQHGQPFSLGGRSNPADAIGTSNNHSPMGNKSSDDRVSVARYHALCAELLQLVLRCLASSKFTIDSARAVARVIWTVSRAAAAAGEELSAIFVSVAEELPRAAQSLEELYTALAHMLAAGGGRHREGDALDQLERLLGDHVASLRGIDVV